MIDITNDMDKVLSTSNAVAYFTAVWCQPCKQMQPVLDKFLAENPDIVYTKYDADANVSTFQEFSITGVPAFVVKVDGEATKYHKGATRYSYRIYEPGGRLWATSVNKGSWRIKWEMQ